MDLCPRIDVFIKKSRMNREVHVRFCERFRGEIPLYLLDFFFMFFDVFLNYLVDNSIINKYRIFNEKVGEN